MAFSFDLTKANNIILFLIQSLGGRTEGAKLCMMLYFADQRHLVRYGTLITGDTYVAMNYGPVPYHIHAMLQQLRIVNTPFSRVKTKPTLAWDNGDITALVRYNAAYLAITEVECLFATIQEHKNTAFDQLCQRSKSTAWQKASNGEIKYRDIAEEAGASKAVQAYIDAACADERRAFLLQ